jgi:hypothetical protein
MMLIACMRLDVGLNLHERELILQEPAGNDKNLYWRTDKEETWTQSGANNKYAKQKRN